MNSAGMRRLLALSVHLALVLSLAYLIYHGPVKNMREGVVAIRF